MWSKSWFSTWRTGFHLRPAHGDVWWTKLHLDRLSSGYFDPNTLSPPPVGIIPPTVDTDSFITYATLTLGDAGVIRENLGKVASYYPVFYPCIRSNTSIWASVILQTRNSGQALSVDWRHHKLANSCWRPSDTTRAISFDLLVITKNLTPSPIWTMNWLFTRRSVTKSMHLQTQSYISIWLVQPMTCGPRRFEEIHGIHPYIITL
jgi:hypothetical protein